MAETGTALALLIADRLFCWPRVSWTVNAFTAIGTKVRQDPTASRATSLVDRSPPRKAELEGAAVLASVFMTR